MHIGAHNVNAKHPNPTNASMAIVHANQRGSIPMLHYNVANSSGCLLAMRLLQRHPYAKQCRPIAQEYPCPSLHSTCMMPLATAELTLCAQICGGSLSCMSHKPFRSSLSGSGCTARKCKPPHSLLASSHACASVMLSGLVRQPP